MSAIQFLTTVSRSVKASLFQNADTMQQVGLLLLSWRYLPDSSQEHITDPVLCVATRMHLCSSSTKSSTNLSQFKLPVAAGL